MPFDRRRAAIAFCAISAFLHLYSPQSVLPFMAKEFGVGAADAGAVITAGTLAVAATAPFAGALSDRLGRRRMIVTAMALLLIPTVMTAFAPTLNALIFWRFVQGLLLPPVFTVTIAYISDEWPPSEAPGVVGLYAAASAAGGFLGRFVPGTLAGFFGWRGGFLALAVLTALCFIAVALLLPPEKNFRRADSLAAAGRTMLGHLANPRLYAIFAVGFGVLFCFIALFTYVSFHLAAPPFSRSAFFLGAIFVVYLIGSGFALMTGRLVAVLGRRLVVLAALALWAGGALLTLIDSLSAIILGLIVASTCGIITQATSTSFVAARVRQGTSAAVGLYVTAFYLGGTVGGFVAGLVYEQNGWTATVALIVAVIAAMAAVVAAFWREPMPAVPR